MCSHHLRRRLRSVAVCSLDASCATRSCWRQPLLVARCWLSALFCNCFEPRRCCSNDASSFEGLLQNDETLYFCNCFQPRCCCNADERAPTQSACLRRRRPTLDVLTRCVGSRCKLRYASIRPLTTVVCGAMLHLSLSSPSAVLHRRACSMRAALCYMLRVNGCLRRSAARVQTLYLRRRHCPVAVPTQCELLYAGVNRLHLQPARPRHRLACYAH